MGFPGAARPGPAGAAGPAAGLGGAPDDMLPGLFRSSWSSVARATPDNRIRPPDTA